MKTTTNQLFAAMIAIFLPLAACETDPGTDPADADTDSDAQTDNPADSDEYGTLSVETTPSGASLSVDGEFKGLTPAELDLLPGQYDIRLTKEGYQEYTDTVSINEGGILPLEVALEPSAPAYNLQGRWSDGTEICDVEHTGNYVRGFCGTGGVPLELIGNELYYHQDDPPETYEGQVHDNDHVSLTITDFYGSQVSHHIRL